MVHADKALKSCKPLFSRALNAAPQRLHFAAHSHHLWPDVSFDAHMQAWNDAARFADRKWEHVFGEVIPAAQRHIADELHLPDASSVAFASNTHELVQRIFSARMKGEPIEVLTSDGEFHSFRRQLARWEEQGLVRRRTVACAPFETFTERYLAAVAEKEPDIAFVSHVMFQTGLRFDGIDALAARAKPDGMWAVIDGYHAFMAMPVDFGRAAKSAFYLAGGYKYAMAGEGAAFLHAPSGYGPRPVNTGWYAEFADIEASPKSEVGYSKDGMRFMGATFDPSGLYRFNAVRAMLAAERLDTKAVAARCGELRDKLETGIVSGKAGVLKEAQILRPNAAGPRARYLALRDPRALAWMSELLRNDVIVDARGDVLRIGIGLYHDDADIDTLCGKLARLTG
ncbi:MAG: aminotransferase class V-fold PLP-dependent enzyme [Proteobacteria bacterium]|nr:aminotransferase class V-fold PLP-dependent enzyme [Pseudomonadota bacterium]